MKNCIVASLHALVLSLLMTSSLQAEPVIGGQATQEGLFSHATVEQAWTSSVKTQKPLLVMFTSDSCVYCRKMLKETYQHPAIERMLLDSTESVLAHASNYKSLVKKLGVRGYPSTLLVSPQGEVLDFMEGYVDAKAFADRVHPLLSKRTARAGDVSSSIVVTTAER